MSKKKADMDFKTDPRTEFKDVDKMEQAEAEEEAAALREGIDYDDHRVFTGSLADFTRSEARERVAALGGRATSGVSGNTDYVVVGEEPGSKRDEAEEKGVKIIDEAAFKSLLHRG
jgi:DNA ligase (NAD+)